MVTVKLAKGNKPPRGFDKRIYTYGHRNVQGIDFRPSDGRPFTAEHGPWHNDEITGLVNGGNGGWDPHEKEVEEVLVLINTVDMSLIKRRYGSSSSCKDTLQ